MAPRFWVDEAFQREVHLADGTRARLRLLIPADSAWIEAGLGKLSPASRYRRFLSATTTLSPAALRYLCETDNVTHLAIVAGQLDGDGQVIDGLGVARFIRASPDSEVAEAAITVIDAAQGKGLGKILLAALSVAARERGVKRFRGEILSSNDPMRALLHEIGEPVTVRVEGEVLALEVALPEVPEVGSWDQLPTDSASHRLLRLAAEGLEFSAPRPRPS